MPTLRATTTSGAGLGMDRDNIMHTTPSSPSPLPSHTHQIMEAFLWSNKTTSTKYEQRKNEEVQSLILSRLKRPPQTQVQRDGEQLNNSSTGSSGGSYTDRSWGSWNRSSNSHNQHSQEGRQEKQHLLDNRRGSENMVHSWKKQQLNTTITHRNHQAQHHHANQIDPKQAHVQHNQTNAATTRNQTQKHAKATQQKAAQHNKQYPILTNNIDDDENDIVCCDTISGSCHKREGTKNLCTIVIWGLIIFAILNRFFVHMAMHLHKPAADGVIMKGGDGGDVTGRVVDGKDDGADDHIEDIGRVVDGGSQGNLQASTPGVAQGLINIPDRSTISTPTVVHSRPAGTDHQGAVIDVLSIGSSTRPEYLNGQVETWASHINIRNFWGVTEQDDYDTNCGQMSSDSLESYVQTCKSNLGWESSLEQFRQKLYGEASGIMAEDRQAGWHCAQRRPGHALGWLQKMYQDQANIPDLLFIVDDDTSVDVEKVKQQMASSNNVGGQCVFKNHHRSFHFTFGGFGTFFSRGSIERMTRPIYCNDPDDPFLVKTCSHLIKNRIGEREIFSEGDSIFDIFYKYAGLPNFCMHSDWLIGYMISYYSGGDLEQLFPSRCKKDACDSSSITCHNHGPLEFQEFMSRPVCQNAPQT